MIPKNVCVGAYIKVCNGDDFHNTTAIRTDVYPHLLLNIIPTPTHLFYTEIRKLRDMNNCLIFFLRGYEQEHEIAFPKCLLQLSLVNKSFKDLFQVKTQKQQQQKNKQKNKHQQQKQQQEYKKQY